MKEIHQLLSFYNKNTASKTNVSTYTLSVAIRNELPNKNRPQKLFFSASQGPVVNIGNKFKVTIKVCNTILRSQ